MAYCLKKLLVFTQSPSPIKSYHTEHASIAPV